MSDERRAPFVAWVYDEAVEHQAKDWDSGVGLASRWWLCGDAPSNPGYVPVVVTPLLPDDPRPGETWLDAERRSVTVLTAPFQSEKGPDHYWSRVVVRRGATLVIVVVRDLRRPPVLKTYRLGYTGSIVRAESREAALAKLASALEEVE